MGKGGIRESIQRALGVEQKKIDEMNAEDERFEREYEPADWTDRLKTGLAGAVITGLAVRGGGKAAMKLAERMGASPGTAARANRLNAKHSLAVMPVGAAGGLIFPSPKRRKK